MSVQTAPIPDTMEGLRCQNRGLRTLNASLEAEIAIHRGNALEYHRAVTSLDSEREANAMLMAEVDGLRGAIDEMMQKHVTNWPTEYRRLKTAIRLIDKTLAAALAARRQEGSE